MLNDNNEDQDRSMWDCDYAPYLTPASEGGKGPENAREVLGIECYHHYGITLHPVVEGEAIADTVYRLTRELWHPFKPEREINVTDDNHTWKNEPTSIAGRFSRIVLYKNEKSPAFNNILNRPSWAFQDGPGAKWFEQKYRLATVGMIAAEIANNFQRRSKWLTDADRYNVGTVAGRKNSEDRRRWAEDHLRLNRILISRHPQLAALAAYDKEAYEKADFEHYSKLHKLYTDSAASQPCTSRGRAASVRLIEWASLARYRCQAIARRVPALAALVPGEELIAA